jgi:hypothetical protein
VSFFKDLNIETETNGLPEFDLTQLVIPLSPKTNRPLGLVDINIDDGEIYLILEDFDGTRYTDVPSAILPVTSLVVMARRLLKAADVLDELPVRLVGEQVAREIGGKNGWRFAANFVIREGSPFLQEALER